MRDHLFAKQPDSRPLFAGRYPMRPHPCGNGNIIEVPDGALFHAPQFLGRKVSDRALDKLLANNRHPVATTDWRSADLQGVQWQTIRWRQDRIRMFGKTVALPRLTAWHGDSDRCYSYSGITLQPQPWNPLLAWLRDQLESLFGIRFNSVLLNWYRSGDDHIGWHADAEPELGTNPSIASINFGATRRFLLRRCDNHNQKIELPLSHGSLLLMSGALQHHWQHAVPRERKVAETRVNLTFRQIHGHA